MITARVLWRGERYWGERDGQPWAGGGGVRIEAGVMSEGRAVRKL